MSVVKYVLTCTAGSGGTPGCGETCTRERLDGRDAAPDREPHEARHVLDAQLQHEAAAVGIDARRRDAETGADLLARLAGDDEIQNLALARAQALERVVAGVGQFVDANEHVPRPVLGVTPQRGMLARPQRAARLAEIASLPRDDLLAGREQSRGQRRAGGGPPDVPRVLA